MQFIKISIDYQTKFGFALYVLSEQTGWALEQARRMEYNQAKKQWEANIAISSDRFDYKYAVGDWSCLREDNLIWERGPNRILLMGKQNRSHVIADKWEKRSVKLRLDQLLYSPLILVYGNCEDLLLPRRMKVKKGKGKQGFRYGVRIYLDFWELEKDILMQYNLTNGAYDKYSQAFTINYTKDTAKRKVQLEQV